MPFMNVIDKLYDSPNAVTAMIWFVWEMITQTETNVNHGTYYDIMYNN